MGHQHDVRLPALPPAKPVIHRRRHQEQRPGHREQEAGKQRHALELRRPAEPPRKRQREQETEQNLGAGKRHAQLGQATRSTGGRFAACHFQTRYLEVPVSHPKRRFSGFDAKVTGIEESAKARTEVRKHALATPAHSSHHCNRWWHCCFEIPVPRIDRCSRRRPGRRAGRQDGLGKAAGASRARRLPPCHAGLLTCQATTSAREPTTPSWSITFVISSALRTTPSTGLTTPNRTPRSSS